LRTASSVASTTAAKNGSRVRSAQRGRPLRAGVAAPPVHQSAAAQAGRHCQEDLAAAVVPGGAGLARPRPARRASRVQAAASSGASVTTITMHEPAGGGDGGCAPVSPAAAGRSLPTGTPSIVSRPRSPKLDSRSTPTVCPDGVSREAVPIPPLKPRQLIPVPAPTAPSAGAGPPTEARASARAAPTSPGLPACGARR